MQTTYFFLAYVQIFWLQSSNKRGRKPLQERIEPPILMSRLMTFVVATAVVVLGVLIVTFDKMFPLNRPQVFFLTSQNLADKELTLTEIPENLEIYKQQFVKEYVRERNEIVPDLAIMRAKWATDDNGIVKTRSTDAVFGQFTLTDMVNIVRRDLDEAFTIKCDVEYPASNPVVPYANHRNTYLVSFTYVCNYGPLGDMEYRYPYKLRVTLESNGQDAVRWAERMQNPLGIRVSGYEVIDSNNNALNLDENDPLNWHNED